MKKMRSFSKLIGLRGPSFKCMESMYTKYQLRSKYLLGFLVHGKLACRKVGLWCLDILGSTDHLFLYFEVAVRELIGNEFEIQWVVLIVSSLSLIVSSFKCSMELNLVLDSSQAFDAKEFNDMPYHQSATFLIKKKLVYRCFFIEF